MLRPAELLVQRYAVRMPAQWMGFESSRDLSFILLFVKHNYFNVAYPLSSYIKCVAVVKQLFSTYIYAQLFKLLVYYVAAKAATYIVCFMAKSAFWGFFRPQLRKKGSDPYSAWMKYVVCLHLYIPWIFGERGSTPRGDMGPSLSFLSFCLFVCLSITLHPTSTESLDGAYTHWTWGERA